MRIISRVSTLVASVPGATHDVLTPDGFYLRILNKESQDLRPTSVWWTVVCRGEVLQVLPENKLIVIEVSTEDWIVLDTGYLKPS